MLANRTDIFGSHPNAIISVGKHDDKMIDLTSARRIASIEGWDTPEEFALPPSLKIQHEEFSGIPINTKQSIAPKEPAMRAQERLILLWLEKNGHDAKNLPKRKNGQPTVKALVHSALTEEPVFQNKTAFKKAWERLRADGEIKEIA
ncbi:MAG: hypothetical protein V4447_07025 [Pseudomonadota bacterium]